MSKNPMKVKASFNVGRKGSVTEIKNLSFIREQVAKLFRAQNSRPPGVPNSSTKRSETVEKPSALRCVVKDREIPVGNYKCPQLCRDTDSSVICQDSWGYCPVCKNSLKRVSVDAYGKEILI